MMPSFFTLSVNESADVATGTTNAVASATMPTDRTRQKMMARLSMALLLVRAVLKYAILPLDNREGKRNFRLATGLPTRSSRTSVAPSSGLDGRAHVARHRPVKRG